MDNSIVYTKTAKGVAELKNGGKAFPPSVLTTLKRVDGRSSVAALFAGLPEEAQKIEEQHLHALESRQLIRIFVRQQEAQESASPDHAFESSAIPLLRIDELTPEEGVRA